MNDPQYSPERRPIASRDKRSSQVLAGWMAARGISPNAISLAGMAAGIAAGGAFAATTVPGWERYAFVAAAVLMQFRLLANMLDGMVAVQCGKASPLGELFNEVPDRVSDTAAFVGAGYAAGGHPVLGFTAALFALFIAYLRAEGKVAGTHQEFCGPMAKPQRVFVLTVAAGYCGLAPMAWQPTVSGLPEAGVMAMFLCLIISGEIVTVVRRLTRIVRALGERQE